MGALERLNVLRSGSHGAWLLLCVASFCDFSRACAPKPLCHKSCAMAMDMFLKKRHLHMDDHVIYNVGSLIIEALALLWIMVLVVSELKAQRWKLLHFLRSKCRSILARKAKRQLDQHAVEQLDWLRCRMTLRLWNVFFVIVICRLVKGQVQEALGFQRFLPEIDFTVLFVGAASLLLKFKPDLITPRSLDIWYVVVSLILNLSLIPAAYVEVKDMLVLTFLGRFLLAVLVKRTWCFVFCTLINVAQILWMARLQALKSAARDFEDCDSIRIAGGPMTVVVSFWIFIGIFLARKVLEENAMLKLDLQCRTVELGAVSSLLTACYDAVLEASTVFLEREG